MLMKSSVSALILAELRITISSVQRDTLSSMNANALVSLGWERKVSELVGEITNQVGRSPGLVEHFRSELRVYGLCLAHARIRIEQANGIQNSERRLAADDWSTKMELLANAYDLPDDGSVYGILSVWFRAAPQSRADQIEQANRAVDAALLKYCAK